jgi:hypothetical protein
MVGFKLELGLFMMFMNSEIPRHILNRFITSTSLC